MVRDASGGILFSGLSEKSMQKRDAGDANSAYAPNSLTFGFFAWFVSLLQPIEAAEQKRTKPESLRMDSGQILFDFAGTNICRSRILDGRNSVARPKGVLTTETKRQNAQCDELFFQARSAINRVLTVFSSISFLPRQKRYGPRSGGDGAPDHTAPSAHPKYVVGDKLSLRRIRNGPICAAEAK